MSSHFSAIGFPIESEDDLSELTERVIDQCEPIAVKQGRYLRWSSECGAELWLQIDRKDNLVGINPHFTGPSSIRVALIETVNRSDASTLDGAFRAWANSVNDDPQTVSSPQSGSLSVVFDAPDFRTYSDVKLPSIGVARIAAFAHEFSVYDSVEAYDALQVGEVKFASQSFVPSGMFSLDAGRATPPEPDAVFTGHVRRTEKRTNELTGIDFYWAETETLAGVFDVVVDAELVTGNLQTGSVIQGSFWLSGRLKEYSREEPGFFGRLFSGRR